jgi:uncharacterized membrane protein YidH (DUF202 family)
MVKKRTIMAEQRTQLAEKRTKLARERTVTAYIRTSATIILFGFAFVGFALESGSKIFFYTGLGAIILGGIIGLLAVQRGISHSKDIQRIRGLLETVINREKTE